MCKIDKREAISVDVHKDTIKKTRELGLIKIRMVGKNQYVAYITSAGYDALTIIGSDGYIKKDGSFIPSDSYAAQVKNINLENMP